MAVSAVHVRPITRDALASELWRIPPLAGTLSRLLEVAHDDTAGMEEVARAVELDEVLATHVLRAANSALLGQRSQVSTIPKAVGRVGCSTVLSLAIAQAISDSAPLARSVGGVPRLSYWEHNWAVATAAACLASAVGLRPGEAHLAGLLHDLGKLLLASREPGAYDECVAEAAERGEPLQVVEQRTLGMDHATAGAIALATWKMPEHTVVAAQGHHGPLTPATPAVGVLAGYADALAHDAGIGASGSPTWPALWDGPPSHPKFPERVLRRCEQHLEQQRRWVLAVAAQFA
jgi:putative nucleotidyltransferase with HDIG domain